MAALLTVFFLTGTRLTNAQTDCIRINDKSKTLAEIKSVENSDCWEEKAKLGSIDLDWAYLNGVDMHEYYEKGEDPEPLSLSRRSLRNADLSWGRLTGVTISYSNLTNANLTNARMASAKLREADLSGADLSGANLSGADMTGTILTNAIASKKTIGIDFADWKKRGGIVKD